jgi:glycosyltransferase involved in cell wall biosynthesis
MKKISVIIPAYNKAELTVRTVQSVLDQSYENIEVLVVDDGSNDDTRIRLQLFGDKIKYLYKENGGACSARNLGIRKSSGEYIALIDCDDLYYPDKILKSVKYLDKNTEIGFVHTAINLIDNYDDTIGYLGFPVNRVTGYIARRLIVTNLVNNSTVVIRRECFEKVGLFDESIFIPADWDMWLRLAEDYKAGYIDEPLSGYRITENYSINHLQMKLKESVYVLEKAIKRNKIEFTTNLINRCYANLYYRMGKLHGANGEIGVGRDYFKKALKYHFSDLKIITHYFLSLLLPKILEDNLRKRHKTNQKNLESV